MMNLIYKNIGVSILLLMALSACKKNDGFVHNPSAPILVDSFLPSKGGYGTEVLIYGNNFTTARDKISITLNGMACEVVGVNQGQVLVKVPLKAGTGKFAVTIDGETKSSDAAFSYIYAKKVTTVAGNGSQGFIDQVAGTAASFYFYDRTGLTIDGTGNLYIADCGNHIVRKINTSRFVTTFAGHINGEGYADGPPSTAMLNLPTDVEMGKDGNLYVADRWNWFVRKIAPDGTASSFAAIADPAGIGVDKATGNIYVASPSNGEVYQVLPDGTVNTLPVSFNYPSDVAVDTAGYVWVVDQGLSTIVKLDPTGGAWTATTIAGIPGTTGSANGGPGTATFNNPVGITIDKQNNIYISDYFNNNIRMIDAAGTTTTFIGTGSAGYKDGDASEAQFSTPSSVVFDKDGNMYVLDRGNGYIRKVTIQ
ncbi:IPT/TIG domain-containing protein [Flavitalea sp. BT771]|uniref:IPT/TIG domain-containing protein n=1 Tax=Flavitalea sp. BT771 TaxID=3063329 RepID=UPI0026E18AAE|nr:IPT/TIG domain-containing protein [Flavitalea sp. BT771]MDO6430653.1 IPT/TIG domain-containing protein [Flavitalea sp. BT771]MDV6219207.1 IPT/TIG domain-containing protein [Flavitalea sp. BT771]